VNIKSCQNCTFALKASGGTSTTLVCINKSDSPGQLHLIEQKAPCRNFQAKRKITPPRNPTLLNDESVKLIPLTQGKFAIVDAEDYDRLVKYKWHTNQDGNNFYAYTFLSKGNKKKRVFMHRLIMNAPKGLFIDHIDGNGLNNRKCNLRLCTPAQNVQNSRPRSNTSSKYKGVFWNKTNKKWIATIHKGDNRIYLGGFDDEIEAALAYDRKAAELFGEFAYLNFGTPHILPAKAGNGDHRRAQIKKADTRLRWAQVSQIRRSVAAI